VRAREGPAPPWPRAAATSRRTQIWLVTHSERLAAALAVHAGVTPRTVAKQNGETVIEGLRFGAFRDDEGDLERDDSGSNRSKV
jgi:predicted ATPase